MAEVPLSGAGRVTIPASPDAVWAAMLDPAALARLIPGAETVERPEEGRFIAVLSLGVGRFRGRQRVELRLGGVEPSRGLDLSGEARGPFGAGQARGRIALTPVGASRTVLEWRYDGTVRGPVTLVGGGLLRLTSSLFIGRVFAALARYPFPPAATGQAASGAARPGSSRTDPSTATKGSPREHRSTRAETP